MHSIQFPVVNEIKNKKRKLNNSSQMDDDNALSLFSKENVEQTNKGIIDGIETQ